MCHLFSFSKFCNLSISQSAALLYGYQLWYFRFFNQWKKEKLLFLSKLLTLCGSMKSHERFKYDQIAQAVGHCIGWDPYHIQFYTCQNFKGQYTRGYVCLQ
jgi:hypothetical protein